MADLVVIGCGNPTRADDGFGIEVIRRLAARPARTGVRVLDAGTDGMAVMFAARGATSLMIVDACKTGAAPGTLFEVPADVVANPPVASYTLHDFRWDHALYAGRKIFGAAFPADVTVWLGEAGSFELGGALTPAIAALIEPTVARIAARIAARLEGSS